LIKPPPKPVPKDARSGQKLRVLKKEQAVTEASQKKKRRGREKESCLRSETLDWNFKVRVLVAVLFLEPQGGFDAKENGSGGRAR
jgi:hypothetical protein